MKTTKRSLLASGLAVLVCIAMLAGATFAWFTDSVVNKGNKIQSGSLSIDAYAYDLDKDGTGGFTIEGVNGGKPFTFEEEGQDLKKDPNPILNETLWEPGKSSAKLLKVQNNGTLAAKIKLEFVLTDGGLQDALWFDFIQVKDGQVTGQFTKRPMSELATIAQNLELPVLAGQNVQFILVYGMNEEAGNEYQDKSFSADIAILATQYTEEEDGFGSDQYDKDAEYKAWDGETTDTDWFEQADPDAPSYELDSPEALAGLAQLVEQGTSFKDKTIELTGDVSLGNQEWTPIGNNSHPFEGTFDGNGNTVKNLNPTTNEGYTGLFGTLDNAAVQDVTISGGTVDATTGKTGVLAGQSKGSTIQNVTVDGVTVNGKPSDDSYTGGIVGEGYTGTIDGCTVKNSTITGGNFLGGISGQGYAKINNCTVESCQITGSSWKVGGIIGQLNEGTFTFENLLVKDTVITAGSNGFGAIVGFSNYGNKTFNNCDVQNCTLKKSTSSLSGAAGLIGQIYGQSGNIFNFNDCDVSGLKFESSSSISGIGGFVGNGYWRGFSGVTVNFKDCTTEITNIVSNGTATNAGAFVGDGKSNTFNFTGSNTAVTTDTGITELIGNQGATITGEDTVSFSK
ncbi:hypothetical protein [Solibaculum mannosilyticum]|uniref:GLUG domain-containing protein n=1 Tax=Solibaculum mannosilyticum TaxID=2780922 RepID=A0A7I8D3U8_9FIRM|nr:hypothetical protein [Solibaculum mannosilyticum]BCI59913.1 hypothetical protein C12CBH8_05520 [Solibaculum mannosilyticum]